MPAAPVIGVPGVIDPGHEMWLPVRIGLVPAEDGLRGSQHSLVPGHVVAQCVQPPQCAAAPARDNRQQHPRG